MATFREPECKWCSGKRGIEYEVTAPTIVHSGSSGVVSFSGPVGGVNYVVVRADQGVVVTYGRMSRALVYIGDRVGLGQPLGEIAPPTSSETPALLYFGVRIAGRYVDPLSCLAVEAVGTRHAILIPEPSRAGRGQ